MNDHSTLLALLPLEASLFPEKRSVLNLEGFCWNCSGDQELVVSRAATQISHIFQPTNRKQKLRKYRTVPIVLFVD
jgi:hypothetical protein